MAVAYNLVNSSGITLIESSAVGRTSYAGTSAAETITGTDGNNYFSATSGNDTLVGGKGDDYYCVNNASDTVIEHAGQGIDTVVSYASFYQLGDNVENISTTFINGWVVGNSLANIVKGSDGHQTLDGGAGNDILIGGGGADTFIVRAGNGSDVIDDFSHAAGDVIRLDNYNLTSFSDVQAHLTQVGANAVLQLSATESLTLINQKVTDLQASDFELPFSPSNLKMTFDDEFNSFSTYNATTHTGTWDTTFGYSGIANRTLPTNGELQIYMDAAYAGTGKTALGVNPFTLENGSLVITATEATQAVSDAISGYQYTSGLITSKDTFSQEYGYFEMRAEMPNEQGAWPAFWLLPADNSWPPEIDIMEGLGDATTAYMTEHSKSTGVHTHDQSVAHLYDTADDYHTYSVLWTADTITWYIDGDVVKTIATPPDMHKPMYILANVAVGGWAGTPADDFNAQMKIDYIRAYSLDQVSATTPTTPVVTTPTTPVVTTPTTPVVTTPTTPVTSSDSSTKTTTDSSTTTTTPVVTGSVWTDTAANNVFTLKTDHDTFTGVGGGTDTVNSGFSWTLAAGIENLVLTGSSALTAAGNDLDNRLTGNAGASTLIGGAGNDTLIAGTGITTMKGGVGNDAYTVSHTGDIIVELAGQGTDSVTSSVSYTLSANVENMSLTGTASLIGTGNDLDNRIIGNAGTSTLIGGAGNDSLIAGTGVTTMKGGVGNDMYTVSHTADVIVENANEGTDSVSSSVTYSLSANIENMSLTGTAAINGTGNALDNRIIGNDGNNSLYGLAGNDYLLGGKGDDKLYGGSGADTFAFRTGDGHDIISDFSISDNDKIDLSAMHAKATAHLSQVGSNVLISFVDGQTITILNESATDKNFLAHIAW